jgi:dUTP pyrophosphatase
MKIKIKKLHPDAITPTYGTAGAACFDLYALDVTYVSNRAYVTTGLAFEVPEGHVMMIYSRSGMGFNRGVRLANCVGVIDSDYRGEVKVALHGDRGHQLEVHAGDRIAQAMIIPINQVSFDVVVDLSNTDRGAGGFGSSGK